jgi:hypothetical protein
MPLGRMVIIVDDEDRENEGDLACAAVHVTPQIIAFMAREGRGLICLPLDGAIADRLELPLMVTDNRSPYGTNFTVSIEAATWGDNRNLSGRPRANDPGRRRSGQYAREIWSAPATSFRSGRDRVGCSNGRVRPRLRSIWRASADCARLA